MKVIELNKVIDSAQWRDDVCSVDWLKNELNTDEKEVRIDIDCDGGSVAEGLKMYDLLRTSGKNIYTNIVGGCHSMAMVILLSAPSANRSANPNCRALVHKVYTPTFGFDNADTLRKTAEDLEREEKAILDIYVDRTGKTLEQMQVLMNLEKELTAQELLNNGFISNINKFNTNKKMKKELKDAMNAIIRKVNLRLGKAVNYDFVDADGNVLFSTDKEDDSLELGDVVTLPSGELEGEITLADGRIVIVSEGKIAEVREKEAEPQPSADELAEENAKLKAEVEELKGLLDENLAVMHDLRNEIQSQEEIATRKANVGEKTSAEKMKENAKFV